MLEELKSRTPQTWRNAARPYAYFAARCAVGMRQAVTQRGSLPHFVIIGAQKGGTTTLYDLLIRHPQILPARTKEISFFDRYWNRGPDWYRANFPAIEPGRGCITGEATPDYLYNPHAPGRMKQIAGDAKLIVLLRNPVDRAISHYFHERRLGYEDLCLEDALAAEESRLCSPDTPVGSRLERRDHAHCFSYIDRGRYAAQLRRWFEVFPRGQVFVETSEAFFADPLAVTRSIFAFLGLEDFTPADVRPRNIGSYSVQTPPDLYAAIRSRFEEDRAELAALLGRELPW